MTLLANSKSWLVNNTATEEDAILENLNSLYGMKQLISSPTHILQHYSSSMDHISVNQSNLVIDSAIHLSLLHNCHHQIMFCKLNLITKYPPPCAREIWVYGMTQTGFINRAIDQFDWVKLFLDKKLMNK